MRCVGHSSRYRVPRLEAHIYGKESRQQQSSNIRAVAALLGTSNERRNSGCKKAATRPAEIATTAAGIAEKRMLPVHTAAAGQSAS